MPKNGGAKSYIGWSKETYTSFNADISSKPPLISGDYHMYVFNQWGASAGFPVTVHSVPFISGTDKQFAITGGEITISGLNFDQSSSRIIVDGDTGNPIPAYHIASTSLRFKIPANMISGKHAIQVADKMNNMTLSNSISIDVTSTADMPIPVISSVTPGQGRAGDIITITGGGFVSKSDFTTIEFYMSNIWFGSMYTSYISTDGAMIKFIINKTFVEQTKTGDYQIKVSNSANKSNIFNFTILP